MVLRKVLGAVVSLVFFMLVYLPQNAFASCCNCYQGKIQCARGCDCGCTCGDANGKRGCITKIDFNEHIVTFEDPMAHEVWTMNIEDDKLKGRKVGDCGIITSTTMQVQECTGFDLTGEAPNQQGMQQQKMPMTK